MILNILWLVLAGFWLALAYLLAALVMFILIITIPFALQALKLASVRLLAVRADADQAAGRRCAVG